MSLRKNRERADQAIVWIKVAMILSGIMLIIQLWEFSQLLVIHEYSFYDFQRLQSTYIFIGVVGLIIIGLSVVVWVFYIRWFRRAYYNLHLINGVGLRYGEGMAAGAWFIPIFWWFGPFQIANDLLTKTEQLLDSKGLLPEGSSRRKSNQGWWWGAWVSSNILSSISNQGEKFDDISVIQVFSVLGIIATFGSVVAGFLCLRMIKDYSSLEELLPEAVGGESGLSMYIGESSDLLDD